MKELLKEIAALADHATTQPTESGLPGVILIKGDVPQHQLAAIYEPMIGFVVQGGKSISIGDQTLHLKSPSYFIVPMEVPASGQVHQGKNGAPYLSVGLRLNPDAIMNLLNDLPEDFREGKASPHFSACEATYEFIEAWWRMLRLLKNPKDIPALAPVYEREILYRVLTGPEGWRLRQISLEYGKASKIRQAANWIRENHSVSIDIKKMAMKSGMGVTTFHRQFKQITGLSPIQFQKQLRLLEARKRLIFSDISVAEAAFEVGYESTSQFNREYSRLFGAPPARDVLALKR